VINETPFHFICSYFFISACTEAPGKASEQTVEVAKDNDISRIERGLTAAVIIKGQAPQTYSIESRLAHHKIPWVSLAVAYEGELLWSKAYGFADIEKPKEMTTETMLLAGPISKPVSALRALQLHDQSKFLIERKRK
jgi:CubicO group peptidase (beta-lactamase class C family)